MKSYLLVLSILLVPEAAAQPKGVVVGIEMRNVRLHVAADATLDVKWLSGRLRSNAGTQPPVFDDQRSFTMEVDDGEMGMDAASLTALVNRAFDYKGASLSDPGQLRGWAPGAARQVEEGDQRPVFNRRVGRDHT